MEGKRNVVYKVKCENLDKIFLLWFEYDDNESHKLPETSL